MTRTNGFRALAIFLALTVNAMSRADERVLDDFEKLKGWTASASQGTRFELAQDLGRTGMGMRLDFNFAGGAGFIIIRKAFSIPLPENYAFSFYIRAEAPVNNVEFKLLDPSGQNVWWRKHDNFKFPVEWQRVRIKKQRIQFAWGPSAGAPLKQVGAVEFAITSSTGGSGSIWLDDFHFEKLDPSGSYNLTPVAHASTATDHQGPESVLDGDPATRWKSGTLAESPWLMIDFLKKREYGGLVIDWAPEDYATHYQVQVSDDGKAWQTVYTVAQGNGGRDYVYMPDVESRYVRLDLQKSSRGQGYGISAVDVKPFEFSASPNQFFEAIARDAPRGLYPKYFYGEQTYWTVIGADVDSKEGLLNEVGALEVDKGAFSIEPFLYADGTLTTWNDVESAQELERSYLPIPSVTWDRSALTLKTTAFATGEPGDSTLYARYRVENTGYEAKQVSLFLAVRPFQVNPPWQSLNMEGGTAEIRELDYDGRAVVVNREKTIVSLTEPSHFGATLFDQGSITDYLLQGKLPAQTHVASPSFSYASGALEYDLYLQPGASREIYIAIPFHDPHGLFDAVKAHTGDGGAFGRQQLKEALHYWDMRLNRVDFQLPDQAQPLLDTLKSTLAYTFINQDGPALQPGSRTYARAWIRDGALISAALLGMGYTEQVRDFIKWYAKFQFADGKIACCVDSRGPDSVAEHDSEGEFIYAVAEYYRYTRDVGFVQSMWPHIVKAVRYIDGLRRQRLTEEYRKPANLPYYGLMPESISHEGYSSHPVHAYWDDFWTLKGLKDAANLAGILGDQEHAAVFATLRDEFQKDLYTSLDRVLKKHKIEYIPGSVELGDFDPASTAVAVAPVGEQNNLPPAALARTFDDYYQYFSKRRQNEIDWNAYAPYELRLIETFVRLGDRTRAWELLDYFMADRRPPAWNQWAEVVWHDAKAPKFIGDMPHTWIGAEFIRSLRSLFAFEQEADRSLVIAAGVPREWMESDMGVSVKRMPTWYGTLNYLLRQERPGELRLSFSGDITLPPGKIVVKPPLNQPLKAMTINGRPVNSFSQDQATIEEFPAEVVLSY
jgi:hypothetical protein